MGTTNIGSLHHVVHVPGGVPRGEHVAHGRPIADRTKREETHYLSQAGIYGQRGAAVADSLRRLIATA